MIREIREIYLESLLTLIPLVGPKSIIEKEIHLTRLVFGREIVSCHTNIPLSLTRRERRVSCKK